VKTKRSQIRALPAAVKSALDNWRALAKVNRDIAEAIRDKEVENESAGQRQKRLSDHFPSWTTRCARRFFQ